MFEKDNYCVWRGENEADKRKKHIYFGFYICNITLSNSEFYMPGGVLYGEFANRKG